MNKKTTNKNQIKTALVFFCLFLFSATSLISQEQMEVIKGGEATLKSKVLNEDRVVSIHLPASYNFSTNRFPVVYLLDGKTHFNHAKGAVEFLTRLGQIPEVIIVAIHNIDRSRDFSPAFDERIPTSGGADKFSNFLADELKPFINDKYRTSDYSVIMGHSFGGTFISYSLLSQPGLFDGYIAISPYLHFVDNYVVKMAEKELKSVYKKQKNFYMTVGNEPNYFSPLGKFANLIKEKSANSINFEYTKMEAENHATIPYVSFYNGMRFVFSDWQLSEEKFQLGLAAIDKHYKNLSIKYGLKIYAPELVINRLGYTYLQNGDTEKAIEIFTENTKRYPHSANVYDSLGEAYETNNVLNAAKKNYKKAYELGKEQNHVNTSVYLQNMNRVK